MTVQRWRTARLLARASQVRLGRGMRMAWHACTLQQRLAPAGLLWLVSAACDIAWELNHVSLRRALFLQVLTRQLRPRPRRAKALQPLQQIRALQTAQQQRKIPRVHQQTRTHPHQLMRTAAASTQMARGRTPLPHRQPQSWCGRW